MSRRGADASIGPTLLCLVLGLLYLFIWAPACPFSALTGQFVVLENEVTRGCFPKGSRLLDRKSQTYTPLRHLKELWSHRCLMSWGMPQQWCSLRF